MNLSFNAIEVYKKDSLEYIFHLVGKLASVNMSDIKCVKVEANNELDRLLLEKFTYPLKGWMEVGKSSILLPLKYKEILEDIDELNVTDEDIFVVSFPRSGTTWTMEMVWLIENDCDFEAARRMISGRYLYLEGSCYAEQNVYKEISKVDSHMDLKFMKNLKESPRFFKSHLPWDLLPKRIRNKTVKPKIIFVSRNAKDACVSNYHFFKSLVSFNASLDEFCQLFLGGRAIHGPYWPHFYSYWNRRNDSNILHIEFEDMKTKMHSVITKVANFLGRPIREDQIDALEKHLRFETMRRNMFVNYELGLEYVRGIVNDNCHSKDNKEWDDKYQKFMRKGKIGSHKEEMNEEIIKKFDTWIAENTKETDLYFD